MSLNINYKNIENKYTSPIYEKIEKSYSKLQEPISLPSSQNMKRVHIPHNTNVSLDKISNLIYPENSKSPIDSENQSSKSYDSSYTNQLDEKKKRIN